MACLSIVLILSISLTSIYVIHGQTIDIGVCYGFNGDNLPSPVDVVNLYKQYGIRSIRLFEPNTAMLEALRGSEIDLILGVTNKDIVTLANSESDAEQWFVANIAPYLNDIVVPYVSIGNEVVPSEFSDFIVPAMANLQSVMKNHGFHGMRASTTVNTAVLTSTYPPSASIFTYEAKSTMIDIVHFLSAQGAPLLVTIYPYYAYVSDPEHVRLDYSLFTANSTVVRDGNLSYANMYDAMMDGMFWAMEKEGVSDVEIVVAETGWPHDGNGNFTTIELAKTYNRNFMRHIMTRQGTPKRPGTIVEGYIFSMIDEDQKPPGIEQFFGMFKPNKEPNYNIFS